MLISDIDHYERLLKEGFQVISDDLAKQDQVFVDTKFEFGYVTNDKGQQELIYMDEVGTPDSSRIWDGPAYRDGKIVEQSKEAFRQFLLGHFADPDVLLDKNRMPERSALARDTALPASAMLDVSKTYLNIAEKITGHPISVPDNPREEIIQVLADNYQLIRT